MDDESAGSVDSLVRAVFQNVRAQLATLATGTQLAWAELRVVAAHAGLFLGLIVVAAGIFLVGWGLFLLCSAFFLVTLGFTTIVALISVFILNLLAFVAVCLYLRYVLKIISFKHTRKALGMESVGLSRTE